MSEFVVQIMYLVRNNTQQIQRKTTTTTKLDLENTLRRQQLKVTLSHRPRFPSSNTTKNLANIRVRIVTQKVIRSPNIVIILRRTMRMTTSKRHQLNITRIARHQKVFTVGKRMKKTMIDMVMKDKRLKKRPMMRTHLNTLTRTSTKSLKHCTERNCQDKVSVL